MSKNVLKRHGRKRYFKLLEKCQIASNSLSIPVSSATSERVFFTSGNILNEGKTRLLSSYLEKLLFLNKNM